MKRTSVVLSSPKNPKKKKSQTFANPIQVLQTAIACFDAAFLAKQQSYQLIAETPINNVDMDVKHLQVAMKCMIDLALMHSSRKCRLAFIIRENLQATNAFELSLALPLKYANVECLREIQQSKEYSAFEKAICRTHGSCSLIVEHGHLLLSMVCPKAEGEIIAQAPRYQLTMVVQNYPHIRKSFGEQKSKALLGTIETIVKSLVRIPDDTVQLDADVGQISVIYEAKLGNVSLSSRISRRLGSEQFRIGKHEVPLQFRYSLAEMRAC